MSIKSEKALITIQWEVTDSLRQRGDRRGEFPVIESVRGSNEFRMRYTWLRINFRNKYQ